MNFETTITAEAADNVAADVAGSQEAGVEKRSGIPRWLLFGGIGVFGLLLAIAAYFVLFAPAPAPVADDSSQAPVVTVIAPGKTTVEGVIEAPGTLAARREMPVGVAGEGGQVLRVLADAGDWVNAGQVLAVVDRSVQVQQTGALAAQIEVR
ncbi:MAG: efflux RND transporter periplasmic adaptor subunit, partial [Pseudomonadota bacterium]